VGIFNKRITNTPKEKVMNTSFEEIIRDYLNNEAKNDPAFAEKWDKRKANDNDAVKGCCSYIMAEAKKKAQNGCAVIADAEVFGWAFHYIQEDIKAPEKKESAKVSFTPPTPEAEVPNPAPKEEPAKPKKAKVEWPSLFNFDE
jgi:hypothetical protein